MIAFLLESEGIDNALRHGGLGGGFSGQLVGNEEGFGTANKLHKVENIDSHGAPICWI